MNPSPPSLEQLFDEALEIPAADRSAWLDERLADHPDLRAKLERLLDFDAPDLDVPVGDLLVSSRRVLENGDETGELSGRIGAYEIVGKLGAGGMGIVLEARQDRPQRSVALKLIRPELATREARRRFEREAQILAKLQHPGIAQVYEVGEAETLGPSGRPFRQSYLAMELIRGVSIDQYARRHALTIEDRVSVMAQACDAVHHAHLHGVVHRDLKPGNIFVNNAGYVKILDFGVARLMQPNAEASLYTCAGQIIGTPAYMSPEQVCGSSPLDARSDVYALGVVLYELLAGRLPYEVREASFPEAARRIREEEPTRLSRVDARLRGDLDTIVAKALEKEPHRRYATAAALADDLRRYLTFEPIAARPVSTWYQIVKFSKRNRRFVAALLSAFVLLVAAVVVTVSLAVQSAHIARDARRAWDTEAFQRRLAEHNLARAEAMQQLLLWGLGFASGGDETKEFTVAQMLDLAVARIPTHFAGRPRDEAMAWYTLGKIHAHHLRHSIRAIPYFERALELWTAHGMPDDATLVWTYSGLMFGRSHMGYDPIELYPLQLELIKVLQRQIRSESAVLADAVDEMLAAMLPLEPAPDHEIRRLTAQMLSTLEASQLPCDSAARYAAYYALITASTWIGNRGISRPSSFNAYATELDTIEIRCPEESEIRMLWRWLVARNLAIMRRDPQKVVEICDRIIDGCRRIMRPDDFFISDAIGIKGSAFAQLGRLDEAERLLIESNERLKQREPTGVLDSVSRLITFADLTERWGAAAAALREFAEQPPSETHLGGEERFARWSKFRDDRAWIVVRTAGRPSDAYEAAAVMADQVVRYAPDNANYVNTLGVARYRTGDDDGALETLKRSAMLAAEQGEDRIADWAFIALAYARLGQEASAREALAHVESLAASSAPLSEENCVFLNEARTIRFPLDQSLEPIPELDEPRNPDRADLATNQPRHDKR